MVPHEGFSDAPSHIDVLVLVAFLEILDLVLQTIGEFCLALLLTEVASWQEIVELLEDFGAGNRVVAQGKSDGTNRCALYRGCPHGGGRRGRRAVWLYGAAGGRVSRRWTAAPGLRVSSNWSALLIEYNRDLGA